MTAFHFLALLALLAACATTTATAADFDLIIRHARIADGKGAPLVPGDVAVKAGRIALVGQVNGTAKEEVDAKGRVVAPGFIDVHTHSEKVAELPVAENFLRMGVTSIVTGNCGGSRTDVAKFFKELEEAHVAIHVATLIGHNSVRQQVMGGSFIRPPNPEQLERMKAMVGKAMDDGAVGLSTGLIYTPGTYAKTDEIVELAKVAAAHGGIYASHMRFETDRIFTAMDELTRIAREAHIPAELSHIKLSGPSAWGRADEVIAYLDKARAEGLKITHDQYVYTASSTGLRQLIPDSELEGTREDFINRVKHPAQKETIVRKMKETLQRSGRTDYSYAVIARLAWDPSLAGKSIPEAAQIRRGSATLDDQIEMILDIECKGGGSGVFHGMSESDLQKFLQHPLTMIASDGGPRQLGQDVPHPRSYGNNARVLGRYVRELKLLKLEEALRRMTSLPAETFHLGDRGVIKTGAWADLVIFDPDKVGDPATFDDPHHYAEGFTDVFVDGAAVIREGKLTDARPGGPLKMDRMPQATPGS
ncbi:MAG TPA: D-aminoacylase [Verrucomicrobiaceae bacterium]